MTVTLLWNDRATIGMMFPTPSRDVSSVRTSFTIGLSVRLSERILKERFWDEKTYITGTKNTTSRIKNIFLLALGIALLNKK